ncbi:uncharacterized protein LOC110847754 isoform X3 [Folsomia candida]|uniref:uncharacterized protein LOC110847754 isoform X3 n=1 Tax=Folsomia candida TaxID=158441 RepID=UPI000B90966A|nr:uncharacterized protein LOC110847754 isoform X3 [Folsomia candida]
MTLMYVSKLRSLPRQFVDCTRVVSLSSTYLKTAYGGLSHAQEMQFSGESIVRSVLGVRHNQAKLIVKKFPQFNSAHPQQLSTMVKYLADKGVPLSRILKNPWLLLIPPDILEKRLITVIGIFPSQSVQVALPFIGLKVEKLLAISSLWKLEAKQEPSLIRGNFSSRVEYLAKILKCGEIEVADFMVRVKRLPMLPFKKIETVLQLLLEGGLNHIDIIEDPWIFIHNLSVMKERLEDANFHGLAEIKPWMLRCSESKYKSYVERARKEQAIKHKKENIDSFLQRRLNWSADIAKDTLRRVPSILNCKASKLENMISFLLIKGFSSEDIAACPRILRQSVATVSLKLEELSELTHGRDCSIKSLRILCESNQKYVKFLNSLKAKSMPQIPYYNKAMTDTTESAQNDAPAH